MCKGGKIGERLFVEVGVNDQNVAGCAPENLAYRCERVEGIARGNEGALRGNRSSDFGNSQCAM